MLDPLRAAGKTKVELLAVTYAGVGWEYHAPGYEQVSFPVMPDSDQTGVYYIYGAQPYDMFLVDKSGKLAKKASNVESGDLGALRQQLQAIHDE